MNAYFYSLLALDIARERSFEAEQHWLATSVAGLAPRRASRLRRAGAYLLAIVSQSTARAAHRLDAGVADDLRRTLAPAD
jgi:hypothetical protein